ncbi:hypothetical protein LTR56_020751 [Elasticomyces elasticus]|nr:hypothetical protein LTR22_025466 [Elasticomyces elasticus]KAK3624854.1 hypothetical protein LTR56_020751 [Elasticomyces elasticus]KAK4909865.1 hypothetical protein LTR49_021405 [Elasticomyces elasticus]
MVDAAELFHHIAEWQIIVCKACRVGVWPDHVSGHLTGQQHRISREDAIAISDEVGTWPGVAHHRSEFGVPAVVRQPIAEIPLHTDGLKCIREPSQCSYICSGRTSIGNHWRGKHGWLIQSGRGGGGHRKQEAVQRRCATGAKGVECQRLFVQARSANRMPSSPQHHRDHAVDPQDPVGSVFGRMRSQRFVGGHRRARGERRETARCSRGERGGMEWKVDQAVWKAMGKLATISQSAVGKSGVTLRMEAVRSEVGQQRFTPLRPYWEATSIERHCRPWQQMLMSFVRTQRPHDWHSPVYRFNRRQKTAFEAMIEAVSKEARYGKDEAESEEESQDEGSHHAGNEEGPTPSTPFQCGQRDHPRPAVCEPSIVRV